MKFSLRTLLIAAILLPPLLVAVLYVALWTIDLIRDPLPSQSPYHQSPEPLLPRVFPFHK